METAQLPNLFLDKETSDVDLHIYLCADDSEVVFPAHSLVLRIAGKIFGTMLDNASLKEDPNANVKLVVKGDTHDAIRFLRYLYTRELEDVGLKEYISLLRTAHLYDLDELVRLCNERIVGKLTLLNICRTYRSLKNLASEELLAYCKDLMLDCAFILFWKNLHLTLDQKTMIFLFESDRLNFLDQEQALGALERWACSYRAFASHTDQDKEQQVAILLTQMKKSLADNASHWLFRTWRNLSLLPETSDLLKKYVLPVETSSLWKYWSSAKDESEANPSLRTYFIKTDPRLRNKITEFAKVCNLIEDKSRHSEIVIRGKSISLMNVSINRNILIAGFSIQIKASTDIETSTAVREHLSFRLNDKELPVNNYEITKVYRLCYNDPKKECEDSNDSNLKICLRTPVFLQKGKMNVLTIEFEPRPLFSYSLTAYTVPVDDMLSSDCTGLFSIEDKKIAVSQLYYFV